MTPIERRTPDVGYLSPEFCAQLGFSQIVSVGDTVHLAGVVAAAPDGRCLAPGDMRAQASAIIGIYRRLLGEEGMTLANIVAVTVYATDMAALHDSAEVLIAAFRDQPPASTWVEIKALAAPDYMLEISAVAAR